MEHWVDRILGDENRAARLRDAESHEGYLTRLALNAYLFWLRAARRRHYSEASARISDATSQVRERPSERNRPSPGVERHLCPRHGVPLKDGMCRRCARSSSSRPSRRGEGPFWVLSLLDPSAGPSTAPVDNALEASCFAIRPILVQRQAPEPSLWRRPTRTPCVRKPRQRRLRPAMSHKCNVVSRTGRSFPLNRVHIRTTIASGQTGSSVATDGPPRCVRVPQSVERVRRSVVPARSVLAHHSRHACYQEVVQPLQPAAWIVQSDFKL